MNRLLTLLVLLCLENSLHAQYIYTIKADSVKITNTCDTAELIIENHTQTVPGFLFNKGRGRTEFRKALTKINDSIYVVGGDTIKLSVAWLQGGNTFGATGFFGTRDDNHIDFYTNNMKRGRWTNTGNLLLGTDTDYGYKLATEGTTYSKIFTNSPTPLGGPADGALRLRWGGAGGYYIEFYYQDNNSRRGFISSPRDSRPLIFNDEIGLSLTTTPFFAIGSEGPFENTKFSLTTPLNSTMDPMRVGQMNTDATSLGYLRVKASGNTILGEGNDNGKKLQVNGTSWLGNDVIIDGQGTGLRILFTTNPTASNLRALETVNGDVKLHTTSGRTSIGLDGSSTITSRLDVSGEEGYNQLRLRKKYTPTSTSDTNGAEGDVSWDDNYMYIKTSSGWKRSTLSTF